MDLVEDYRGVEEHEGVEDPRETGLADGYRFFKGLLFCCRCCLCRRWRAVLMGISLLTEVKSTQQFPACA